MAKNGAQQRTHDTAAAVVKTEAELIRDQTRVDKKLTNHARTIRAELGGTAGIGYRLDKFLVTLFPRFTRSMIQRWIKNGWCLIDDTVASSKQSLRPFQVILLHTPLSVGDDADDARADDNNADDLEILYHQDGVLILNKPPGQLPHQAGKILTGTLLNHIHAWCERTGHSTSDTRLVNRIDRDTSGIVLCSLNLAVHKALSLSLQAHDFKKEYTALCIGVPAEAHGHWRDPIAAGSDATVARAIDPSGQDSHTEYFVSDIAPDNRYALLRIILHTGRQHQIRVHAAHNGHPLIGDWVYGTPCAELGGQALHAAQLTFPHPRGTEESVRAPLPHNVAHLWETLKHGATLTTLAHSDEQRSKLGILHADEPLSQWRKPSWLSESEYQALQAANNEQLS